MRLSYRRFSQRLEREELENLSGSPVTPGQPPAALGSRDISLSGTDSEAETVQSAVLAAGK